MERYNRKKYDYTLEQKENIRRRYNYVCFATKEPSSKKDPLQIHHFLPLKIWYDHFRDIVPAYLVFGEDNGVLLKASIHKQLHEQADLAYWSQCANFLISINRQPALL